MEQVRKRPSGIGVGVAVLLVLTFIMTLSMILMWKRSVDLPAAVEGRVIIDGRAAVGSTDPDFICATLDWWPPEKCDYGHCSWGNSSILNLDLNNQLLLNAVKAFSPLKIRLGGTLQNNVIYEAREHIEPCDPFVQNTSALFGFTQGCLPMKRWDELNTFFSKSRAKIIFGLNALTGRSIQSDHLAEGAWNYTNAISLVRYTVEKNYNIHGWEFGNELSGRGIGVRVRADQYANDTKALKGIVLSAYRDVETKPLVIAPGGFFERKWYSDFIDQAGNSVDVVTHHVYNLGQGSSKHLVERILDPDIGKEAKVFSDLEDIIKHSITSAVAWVGEAGGVSNSGRHLVTDTFVFSFWYLDQLGIASALGTKTYCRQSLIGGGYGLLNTTTFKPNPDYYNALLWHRLMGTNSLATSVDASKELHSYTHCAKQSEGLTLLLINLSGSTTFQVRVAFSSTWTLKDGSSERTFGRTYQDSTDDVRREEYHLTAEDGNLQSQTMLLNGKVLSVDSCGNIPPLEPLEVNSTAPIKVSPFSAVFVHMPDVLLPACKIGVDGK